MTAVELFFVAEQLYTHSCVFVCLSVYLFICPRFLVAEQLYTHFCVFVYLFIYLFVCSPFLIWDIFLFEYLEYSRIFKERENNIISKTENRQKTNKHTDVRNQRYVLNLQRSAINWQRWQEDWTHVNISISCLGWN